MTGEPISSVPEDSVRSEAPFAHSLQEITSDIFIGVNDSPEEVTRKQAGAFYVTENKSWPVDEKARLLRAKHDSPLGNFRDLVGFIARNHSILEGHSQDDLRYVLYQGAELELSKYRLYIAENQILGHRAGKGVVISVADSVHEAQARIAGVESFQRRLLERVSDAAKPQ